MRKAEKEIGCKIPGFDFASNFKRNPIWKFLY